MMEAEVISIQLQSLLNIPPIKKASIPALHSTAQVTSMPVGVGEAINVDLHLPPTVRNSKTKELYITQLGQQNGVGRQIRERKHNEFCGFPFERKTKDRAQTNVIGKVESQIKEKKHNELSGYPCERKTEDGGRSNVTGTGGLKPQPMPRNALGLGVINNMVPVISPNSYNQQHLLQQQYNERTPPYQMTSVRSQTDAPLDGRRVFAPSNESTRSRVKIMAHMNELLRNDQLPRNILIMKEKLMEAALEEHKPTYYLHQDKAVLELFQIHGIEPLTKRSSKFVRAKYFCRLCNYHMDNVTNVVSHVSNARHGSNAKSRCLEQDVENIPFPSVNHELNLHLFVTQVMSRVGIDDADRNLRYEVLLKLNKGLAHHKLELELFGSSVSGFGFKGSDINLNLDLTKVRCEETGEPLTNADHTALVIKLSKILETFPFVRDVGEGHHVLQIKFKDIEADRDCSIQVNNISGTLLAQLFHEYDKLDSRVRPLVVAFRNWANMTQIDDQEQGFLPGHVYTIMVLKHLLDVRVIPYIIDPDNSVSFRSFYQPKDASEKWISPNRQNLGGLWLGLLRKYSVEFPIKELVVSLVKMNLPKSEDKIWNRKFSVEDPVIPRSDLCRSASTSRVFDYIFERIKMAFKYFGLPRRMGGMAIYDKIIPFGIVREPHNIYFYTKPRPVMTMPPVGVDSDEKSFKRQTPTEADSTGFFPSPHLDELGDIPRIRMINMRDYNGILKVYAISEDLGLLDKIFTPGDFYYEFTPENCQGGEEPPKHCRSCGQDGHTKRTCPEEVVPVLRQVSYPNYLTLQLLDSVMLKIYDDMALTERSTLERRILLDDIFRFLVSQFPDIELVLFGSTNNGFGLRGSDVDVSVRFKNRPIRKADFHCEEVSNILKGIVERLRSSGCMQEILAIPSAKVPIVKFKHKKTRLEGDISLSNDLALRNTKLLRAYAEIDPRVKVLGCFLKQLTKLCDISDASKGSLSSYAYVLMLIHYLQQRHPHPVLPVLQQIPSQNRPEHLADGWDTYFFEDIEPSSLCPHWSRSNMESVGELLLGFIKYYTETFNFEENVVSISQLEPLARKEKRWTASTLICIEDPFEKSHNLGAGLTRRMGVFIVKTFQRYREVFFKSIVNFSPNINYAAVFLDPRVIRGQMNPPIDRQCRICNKIGHFANTCNYANMNEEPSLEGGEIDGDSNQNEKSGAQDVLESLPESPQDGFNPMNCRLEVNLHPHPATAQMHVSPICPPPGFNVPTGNRSGVEAFPAYFDKLPKHVRTSNGHQLNSIGLQMTPPPVKPKTLADDLQPFLYAPVPEPEPPNRLVDFPSYCLGPGDPVDCWERSNGQIKFRASPIPQVNHE